MNRFGRTLKEYYNLWYRKHRNPKGFTKEDKSSFAATSTKLKKQREGLIKTGVERRELDRMEAEVRKVNEDAAVGAARREAAEKLKKKRKGK